MTLLGRLFFYAYTSNFNMNGQPILAMSRVKSCIRILNLFNNSALKEGLGYITDTRRGIFCGTFLYMKERSSEHIRVSLYDVCM